MKYKVVHSKSMNIEESNSKMPLINHLTVRFYMRQKCRGRGFFNYVHWFSTDNFSQDKETVVEEKHKL